MTGTRQLRGKRTQSQSRSVLALEDFFGGPAREDGTCAVAPRKIL